MYISHLKINNFLSFVGENDISLQPYTAVMFSCDTGKKDFVSALQFLFGAELTQLGFYQFEELYHDCLVPDVGHSYPLLDVSAVIDTRRDADNVHISRSVANGRMIFKLQDTEVDMADYQHFLNGMRGNKSFFLALSDFMNAMWNADGIEQVISDFVGVDFKLPELQKASKFCNFKENALAMQNERHCLAMIREHKEVDQVVEDFERVLKDQESRRERTLEELSYEIEDYSESPSLLAAIDEMSISSEDEQADSVLWERETDAEKELKQERQREAILLATILYKETKIAAVEDDISVIQERIALKVKLENQLAQLERVNSEVYEELNVLMSEVAMELTAVNQFYLEGPKFRLTAYGRLIDWITPGPFLWILRKALGDSLLYGHLIDHREPAEKFVLLLRERYVETRVTFIILSDYSPKLKEILFGEVETANALSSILDLLKLLCKFKEFGLIPRVPSLVALGDLRLDNMEDEDTIFLSNATFAGDCGVFGRLEPDNHPDNRCVDDVLGSLNALLTDQEMLFDRAREQVFEISKLLLDLDSLAEDVRTFRASHTATPSIQRPVEPMSFHLDEIYAEYSEIFEEQHQLWEESRNSALISPVGDEFNAPVDTKPLKTEVKALKADLRNVQSSIQVMEQQLKGVRQELRTQITHSLQMRCMIPNPFLMPEPKKDKSILALALRMKALRKIIKKDEADELKCGKEWRYAVLEKIRQEVLGAKKELKKSRDAVKNLLKHRETHLTPFIRYCNDDMSELIEWMMGPHLTIGKLRCGDSDPIRLVAGAEGLPLLDIMEYSVFLRCVSLFALFLHMARFRGGVLLVLDELHELFPRTDADAACLLGTDDETDTRFHLLSRLGDAVKLFLDKVREDVGSSPQTEDLSHLDQVVLLTSDDMAVTTEAHVLIVKEVLEFSGKVTVISQLIDLKI